MISDVLSDAIGEIRAFQHTMPDRYDGIKEWIDSVVREMEALRRYLDLSLMTKQVNAMRQFLYCPKDEQRKWLVHWLEQLGEEDDLCREWLEQLKKSMNEGETT